MKTIEEFIETEKQYLKEFKLWHKKQRYRDEKKYPFVCDQDEWVERYFDFLQVCNKYE
jgi:hypothetical protein